MAALCCGKSPVAAGSCEVRWNKESERKWEHVRAMKESESLSIQCKQSAMSLCIYLYPQPNLLSLLHTLILDGKSSHAHTQTFRHTHTRLHKGRNFTVHRSGNFSFDFTRMIKCTQQCSNTINRQHNWRASSASTITDTQRKMLQIPEQKQQQVNQTPVQLKRAFVNSETSTAAHSVKSCCCAEEEKSEVLLCLKPG